MAERIEQDPNQEVRPDHAGLHYQALRTVLTNTGLTNDQAIQRLDESWNLSHEERINAWNQQVAADQAALAQQLQQERERQQQQQEHEQQHQQQQQRQQPQQEENPGNPAGQPGQPQGLTENEKKRSKMADFNENSSVSDFIAPRPSAYALKRLEEGEYVELWYFTQEGCAEASQNQRTQTEESFGLTRVEDVVSLRPLSAIKASKHVIQDIALSWRQISIAKTALIQEITKLQWPAKAVQALAQFFINLDIHPYRQREFGEQALIVYQARVRRNWHDSIRNSDNRSFNIAIMNDNLLQSIHREIMDKAQTDSINEVSNP